MNKRKILAVCIAASLTSHVISLAFLQKRSFWEFSPRFSPAPTPHAIVIDRTQRDNILREAFQEVHADASISEQPHLEDSALSFLPLTVQPLETPSFSIEPSAPTMLKHEFVFQNPVPSFVMPPMESLNLFEYLPKGLMPLSPPMVSSMKTTPLFLPKGQISFAALSSELASPLDVACNPSLLSIPLEFTAPPRIVKFQTFFPEFPSLEDLATSSYSDLFETEIVFCPLENEKGYLFALTLIPQSGLTLPKIRQHYSFLIDRSNSIQKERLSAVKTAVLRAIEELDLEDSFNIIAFDSKIEKLSPAPLPATSSSFQAARHFLDEIQLGSFFSITNLCKPLLLTLPSSQGDEVHTAILFSDGEPLSKKSAQRELALEWTAYNNGRVSLFAIGVGGDPHLTTLDATTAFNRGKVLYAPTKRGIKRKLLKLMKTIGHPVAKSLTATAIARSSETKISLYSKTKQMPPLYLNEPYVLLGTIDKLDDFILFVQGKLKNQWLNIKKNISFVNAKKGDVALKAECAQHCAYSLYELYLRELNPLYLSEAQELLEPHNLPTAFQ